MFILLASVCLACTPDLMVDNFATANQSLLVAETPPPLRFFDLLGGDYGIKDGNITVMPAGKGQYMGITSDWGPADTSEDTTHPNGIQTF